MCRKLGWCARCRREVYGHDDSIGLPQAFPSCNTCDDEDERVEMILMRIRSLPIVQINTLDIHNFSNWAHMREGEMTL